MPKKRRLLSGNQPNFWASTPGESLRLLDALAIQFRVNPPFASFLDRKALDSRSLETRWAQLALCLAGELFQEFEQPPPRKKKGRSSRQFALTFDPYPHADDARLVELFNDAKEKLKRRGDSHRIDDVCAELVRRYAGKYPDWKYNNQLTAGTLKRHGWYNIDKQIKADPERFLPSDGIEPPGLTGRPRLPQLPRRAKS
jgi:hypothetical protein